MPKEYKPFQFKQFSIDDSNSAMKVGTDSILLGSWIDLNQSKNILDVGAGSGILTLMAAQRNRIANITAIEIENKAYKQSKINIKNSTFKNDFKVINDNYLEYNFQQKFDLIISNPPYFDEDVKSPILERSIARDSSFFSLKEFISKSIRLLSNKGRICIILPDKRINGLNIYIQKYKYKISKSCKVRSFKDSNIKLVLLEISSKINQDTINTELIIYESKNQYSKDFKELTKEYYLNF